jgi:hypothetical protein
MCEAVGSFIAHDARARSDLDQTLVVRTSQQLLDNPAHKISTRVGCRPFWDVQSFAQQEDRWEAVVNTYAVRVGKPPGQVESSIAIPRGPCSLRLYASEVRRPGWTLLQHTLLLCWGRLPCFNQY